MCKLRLESKKSIALPCFGVLLCVQGSVSNPTMQMSLASSCTYLFNGARHQRRLKHVIICLILAVISSKYFMIRSIACIMPGDTRHC